MQLRIDVRHKNLNALLFALFNVNHRIEIRFFAHPAYFHPTLTTVVGRGIIFKSCLNLLHAERSEKPVTTALFKRIDVNRVAEVSVSIHIIFSLRRRGKI